MFAAVVPVRRRPQPIPSIGIRGTSTDRRAKSSQQGVAQASYPYSGVYLSTSSSELCVLSPLLKSEKPCPSLLGRAYINGFARARQGRTAAACDSSAAVVHILDVVRFDPPLRNFCSSRASVTAEPCAYLRPDGSTRRAPGVITHAQPITAPAMVAASRPRPLPNW